MTDMDGVPPITISFMLTCYFSPKPAEQLGEAHWNSPAGKETRTWLFMNDLIDRQDDFAGATEKGQAWVKFICQTPLPIQEWRLPDRIRLQPPTE